MKGLKGLKQARMRASLTQKQLSELLNISVTSISLFEQGKMDPTLATLRALSKVLNTSIDFLITGGERP